MASSDPDFRPSSSGPVQMAGPRYVAEEATLYVIRDNATGQLVETGGHLVTRPTPEEADTAADRWNSMNAGIRLMHDVQ